MNIKNIGITYGEARALKKRLVNSQTRIGDNKVRTNEEQSR